MLGIRGATSIEKNEIEHIKKRSIELYNKILEKNDIQNIVTILCSVTPDITAYNPITAIREEFKLDKLPLMTFQEAMFEGSKKGIIRFLILCESKTQNFVFLHDAKSLREDLY
ncbi:chorismate mutase [Marinitoga hydrogenitolerans DSM 16785]|uniref:chorismate mutase n=1 Tax=Marinitoga hydrogenitolerans (strain DSM 16785 / JCM 12826 / AT1271) TaxID=1122195 RepID=A0A1M4VIT5_MARH1|nr:chorismate mutase [Marinitoga hydrogenitolerans]SHE68737.1 chorismate mutase [Marinitoga hydrogenitolerans DSM 16785]